MKITSVKAVPVRLPGARRALGTAGSPTELQSGTGDYWWSRTVGALYSIHFETALVKLVTDSGITGWGEAQAPLAPEVACEIVRLLLRPVLEGEEFDGSVEGIGAMWEHMYRTMRVRGQTSGFMLDAISGVDLALWDVAGQAQGKSVSELIGSGSTPDAVPAYLSGIAGAEAGEFTQNVARATEAGFRTFKLFHDAGTAKLLSRFDALVANGPAGARVAVDALWRFDVETAAAFGEQLDSRDALWLESPLPPEDVPAHAALARRIRTPLAAGECYRTRWEIAPFLREQALAIVQPDLGRCGVTEFLKIAATAREAGARVIPHVSIALGPQIAAAVHAAAACGCEMLEFNPRVLEVANAWLEEPLTVTGGAWQVPRRPGLGVRIREAALRERIQVPRS